MGSKAHLRIFGVSAANETPGSIEERARRTVQLQAAGLLGLLTVQGLAALSAVPMEVK